MLAGRQLELIIREALPTVNKDINVDNINASYGEAITIEENQFEQLPIVYVQAFPKKDGITASSYGNIRSVFAVFWAFGKTGFEAVSLLQDLLRLGFTGPDGKLGYPTEAPFEIARQTVFKWWPIGDVQEIAKQEGSIFVIEQGMLLEYVDFTEEEFNEQE